MLGHRLRRWPNIGLTLGGCLVFAETPADAKYPANVYRLKVCDTPMNAIFIYMVIDILSEIRCYIGT